MSRRIIINTEKCIGCGHCEKVCSKKILKCMDGKVHEIAFDEWGCCGCGLCMSVCHAEAIKIEGLSYEQMADVPGNNLSYYELSNMMLTRRSIRCFSDKRVEREVLKHIVEAAAMAPIGSPPTNVNLLTLDKNEEIEEIYNAAVSGWKKLIKSIKNPIYRFVMKQRVEQNKYYALTEHALPAAKIYCDFADKGRNAMTFDAPAIMFFYGDKPGVCITENCWLSTTYALIAAHSLGIGATISGMIPPVINMNKKFKDRLGIPKTQEIYSCLLLGYADESIKFKRKIPRELASVKYGYL